jgi:hypothetical protein
MSGREWPGRLAMQLTLARAAGILETSIFESMARPEG